jgi:hypothetical protein
MRVRATRCGKSAAVDLLIASRGYSYRRSSDLRTGADPLPEKPEAAFQLAAAPVLTTNWFLGESSWLANRDQECVLKGSIRQHDNNRLGDQADAHHTAIDGELTMNRQGLPEMHLGTCRGRDDRAERRGYRKSFADSKKRPILCWSRNTQLLQPPIVRHRRWRKRRIALAGHS